MTFFDLIKSLIDSSKERLKTPITGAFIWSFLIYNWRPIAVLLFSDAPIEDRIVVVNHEYLSGLLKLLVVLIPIIMAFVYTIGVPMLMVKIEKILATTKKARINKIYEDKGEILKGKIAIAGQELELKNIESGNKQTEELLSQIDNLKESNSQLTASHNNTVNRLNQELEKVNKEYAESIEKQKELILTDETWRTRKEVTIEDEFNNRYAHLKTTLTKFEFDDLINIGTLNSSITNYGKTISNDVLKKFSKLGIVYFENEIAKLTDYGLEFLNSINEIEKKNPMIVNRRPIKKS